MHLCGKLRERAAAARASEESVITLEPRQDATVRSALERIGIPPDEVCHVFLNGALLTTQGSMAPWLQYEQAADSVGTPDTSEALDTPVQDGDRLGLLARDMALLVV